MSSALLLWVDLRNALVVRDRLAVYRTLKSSIDAFERCRLQQNINTAALTSSYTCVERSRIALVLLSVPATTRQQLRVYVECSIAALLPVSVVQPNVSAAAIPIIENEPGCLGLLDRF